MSFSGVGAIISTMNHLYLTTITEKILKKIELDTIKRLRFKFLRNK